MDYVTWKRELEKDAENLELLSLMVTDITPEHDTKLQTLFGLIQKKLECPLILVIGKYSFLLLFLTLRIIFYANVSKFAREKFGLESAEITGTVEGKTTISKLSC